MSAAKIRTGPLAVFEANLLAGHVVLVTGRELDDLEKVFPEMDLCTLIVAENGALLYRPSDKTETRLATPPPPEFAQRLRDRGVTPLSVGRCIVATFEPHDGASTAGARPAKSCTIMCRILVSSPISSGVPTMQKF